MKKYINYLAGALLAFSAVSCADELDQPNPNQFTSENFWRTEQNFTGNLTALMNQWRGFDQTIMQDAGELRTDFYWPTASLDGSSLSSVYVINNQLGTDNSNCQFANYAGFYGMISNCNTYLYYDALRGDNVFAGNDALRNYMKGMIYGMRAWCNFQIHKMWGAGPIRDDSKVIEGIYDDKLLAKPQSTVAEFVANIKADLKKSEEHFNLAENKTTVSTFNSAKGQLYWNPMATQVLAGEVYMWTGKVSTTGPQGDTFKANPADVAVAKTHFLNVINSGKYSLMANYLDAINEGVNNTERIFGTYYAQGEASTNWYNYIQYDPVTGLSRGQYWTCVEKDGLTPSPNAARLNYYYLAGEENVKKQSDYTTFYLQRLTGQGRFQVRNAYYYQFNELDARREILQPNYRPTEEELANGIMNIANFDKETHPIAGCYVYKYRGKLDAASNKMQGWTWMTYYRLPLVYTYLAEIANFEGNNADVEKYINLVRARAYGANFDAAAHGYKAGTFLQNEVAVLQEKAKEFFQEGQRWWDLRRMTAVKNGSDADHLVFRPEGCLGYGLDVAAHPNWYEVTVNSSPLGTYTIATDQPVLDYQTKSYMVLWALNSALRSSEKQLAQTPGYK